MLSAWLLVSAATLQASVTPAGEAANLSSAVLRVRIREGVSRFALRGFDLKIAGRHVEGRSRWSGSCDSGIVRLDGVASGPVVDVVSPGGFLFVDDRPYRESIRIHALPGGGCDIVNRVPVESYLDGLVSSEFSAKWNAEAVAAQIVAARTYAYHQMLGARRDPRSRFDVDATVRDQVYDGSIREDFRASRAVVRTRGMILVAAVPQDPRSRARSDLRQPLPIKAFYHSTCGGLTELPEHVWGTRYAGFRRRVPCPYCHVAPQFRWSTRLSAREIAGALLQGALRLGGRLPVSGFQEWPRNWRSVLESGRLLQIRAGQLEGDGRVAVVDTLWDSLRHPPGAAPGPVILRVPGAKFREWVGASRLRSTAFQVGWEGQAWRFEGRGNGHGVGLCQWGAKVMGEQGSSMEAILKHYYPDARIVRAW